MNIYSGDVVSKDVPNSFRNLLQSGDGTSAKKLGEDFDIQHGDPSIVLTERDAILEVHVELSNQLQFKRHILNNYIKRNSAAKLTC